jgi:NitT/TauT family transport system permease protein
MAQVNVPDDPRVREQFERGGTTPARPEQPARHAIIPRRFGVIDLAVFLVVVAVITLLVLAASRWVAPLTPNVSIDLDPSVLPAYARYSLLRMLLTYLLSLVFTLIYGHVAATNPAGRNAS